MKKILFISLFSVSSFSVNAALTDGSRNYANAQQALDYYLTEYCSGPSSKGLYRGYSTGGVSGNSLSLRRADYSDSECSRLYNTTKYYDAVNLTEVTCPVPNVPNEQTGECEPPPEDFCSSSEWIELSASQGNACAAQYPDFLTDFSAICNSRDDYSFTCNQGIEKPPTPDPDPDPDPTDPDPTDPDPTDPDPTDPDPTDPDPTDPDPTDPDPTDPDPTDPDPTPNPDPTYNNGGNAHGSGSSGGSASASDGNVSVDISFDGVHSRLDAVNDNLAGANERLETTNDLLNGFSNRYNENSKKTTDAIGDLNNDLGQKIDENGRKVSDAVGDLGEILGDIADGSNTVLNGGSCDTFSCDGNQYECFIARKAWKNECLIESLTGDSFVPEDGVPSVTSGEVFDAGNALIDDLAEYNTDHLNPTFFDNGEISISDALSEFDESNGLSFDEKCPSPNVVDTGMGLMTIDYTPFCDLALYVRAMLMLFASIGSILMISKFS